MRTCRQIRHETLPIYYGENEFPIMVHDMDGKSLLPFNTQLVERVLPGEKIYQRMTLMMMSGVNWTNLKAWVKLLYDGVTVPFSGVVPLSTLAVGDRMRVILQALAMVEGLSDLPWDRVEDALEIVRNVAAGYDPARGLFDGHQTRSCILPQSDKRVNFQNALKSHVPSENW